MRRAILVAYAQGGRRMTIADAWSAFWATGQAASCVGGADFDARLDRLWCEFAQKLEPNARIIDLAAGAGAAARSVANCAQRDGRSLHIDAVDAATLPTKASAESPLICFHSGVPLESLPFPNDAFDAAISQFGFEYADEAKASSEAARVLKHGARLRFIMHARDGAVFADVQARVDRLNVVLAEKGAATLARDLAHAAAADQSARVAELSQLLPQALEKLRVIAQGAPRDDAAMFYATAFLRDWRERMRFRPSDLAAAIDAGWINAAGVAARQQALLHAAKSQSDMDALRQRLQELNFTVEAPQELVDANDAQAAWLLDAIKS